MKIGCGTVVFRKVELEKALDAIRGIGFEYFETQAVGPWCPHVNIEKDDPQDLVRLKNKYGFKGITGLWSYNGNIIANPNAVDSVKLSVEWAAAAGIPIVHMGDGKKPDGVSDEDAFKIFEDKLAAIMETAKKLKVTLAVEPHGSFSLALEGLKRILSLGESGVLGINYDACNIFRAGYVESGNGMSGYKSSGSGENELEVLKGVLDRVVHYHAKDINGNKKCVALGEGLVQNADCIKLLKEISYNGVVSLETEGDNSFEDAVALATKSFNYLNDLINR
ncbi:MAG: sugar phosphate isomerase/epimerase [Ruminococcaceae bacterium]|nr:sugar phosphate isomerase/epimerase [Oscillospiraceae bacterium]